MSMEWQVQVKLREGWFTTFRCDAARVAAEQMNLEYKARDFKSSVRVLSSAGLVEYRIPAAQAPSDVPIAGAPDA